MPLYASSRAATRSHSSAIWHPNGPSKAIFVDYLIDSKGNEMVEAAGVEPASEKARHEEPTCVADSATSAAASEPARNAAA